jgi:hypothetical protein
MSQGFTESVVGSSALVLPETLSYKAEHDSNIAMGELARAHSVEAVL